MTDEEQQAIAAALWQQLEQKLQGQDAEIEALRDEVKRLQQQVRSLRADVDSHSQRITFLEGERTDYISTMTGKSSELRYRLEMANNRLREHDLEPV